MTVRITKVRQDGVHQIVYLFVRIKNNIRSTILMFRNGEPISVISDTPILPIEFFSNPFFRYRNYDFFASIFVVEFYITLVRCDPA